MRPTRVGATRSARTNSSRSDDEELEAIQITSTHTIEIDRFVPSTQIDKRYFDAPYYIAPTNAVGQEAFAVIRDAMRGRGMAALGRVVISRRERVIAIEPYDKGLLATTLRYPYEIREAAAYFEDIADVKVPGRDAEARRAHPRQQDW